MNFDFQESPTALSCQFSDFGIKLTAVLRDKREFSPRRFADFYSFRPRRLTCFSRFRIRGPALLHPVCRTDKQAGQDDSRHPDSSTLLGATRRRALSRTLGSALSSALRSALSSALSRVRGRSFFFEPAIHQQATYTPRALVQDDAAP